jgi:hypothetical protein
VACMGLLMCRASSGHKRIYWVLYVMVILDNHLYFLIFKLKTYGLCTHISRNVAIYQSRNIIGGDGWAKKEALYDATAKTLQD